ncbi:MAG: hypothetical protein WBW99_05520 [Pseudolabrys sp.]
MHIRLFGFIEVLCTGVPGQTRPYNLGKAVSVAEIAARLQSPGAFQPTELVALAS